MLKHIRENHADILRAKSAIKTEINQHDNQSNECYVQPTAIDSERVDDPDPLNTELPLDPEITDLGEESRKKYKCNLCDYENYIFTAFNHHYRTDLILVPFWTYFKAINKYWRKDEIKKNG